MKSEGKKSDEMMMCLSDLAAHNGAKHEAHNYRMPLKPIDGFKAGDYVPLVIYNALAGTEGTGLRTVAQRTHARLTRNHALLDSFNPEVNLTFAPDQEALFELRGYLIDVEGKEHLFFTTKMQRN